MKKEPLELKAASHNLKPVVIIGAQGVTQAVQDEINTALTAHELIKIKLNANSGEERKQALNEITSQQKATLINQIGHVAVLYRKQKKQPDSNNIQKK